MIYFNQYMKAIKTVYDDSKFIKKHVGDVYMMLEKMENVYIIEL